MPAKLSRDDYDDYDEEEYFDDYDDAADDWEAEAAEEEEKAMAEQAAKAALAERKLQTRAPAAGQPAQQEEEEEALPQDVHREVERMRQEANDIAAGGELVSGSDRAELLADAPTETAEQMRALGEKIAEHLLSFAEETNFDTMFASLCESLGKEFVGLAAINENFTRAEKALEASKRAGSRQHKKKGGPKDTGINVGGALDIDVEDKGGAYVEDGDAFF